MSKNRLAEVYVIKHPASGDILGVFSDYNTAVIVTNSLLNGKGETAYLSRYIEEFDLDPYKEQIDKGLLPWVVRVDLTSKETHITDLREPFLNKTIKYTKWGAIIHVFAQNEEQAELQALEIFNNAQIKDEIPKEVKVFEVLFDIEGNIVETRSHTRLSKDDIVTKISENSKVTKVRLVANDINEAILQAPYVYREWVQKQEEKMLDNWANPND
jgi:hypothetical protein